MQKNAMTVGETTLVNTEKGSMSNEQVINLEDLKEAWMEFAEHCYEVAYEQAIDNLDQTIGFLDKASVITYLNVAEEAQDLYKAMDKCNSMEDCKNILEWNLISRGVKKHGLKKCVIDEETVVLPILIEEK